MNKKHVGSSVMETIEKWEKNPVFKKAVDERIEKVKLSMMLKEIRQKEHLTQEQLAAKAHVTQSVIARIETGTSRTLPRLDLFNKILRAVGYITVIEARKKGRTVRMALAA